MEAAWPIEGDSRHDNLLDQVNPGLMIMRKYTTWKFVHYGLNSATVNCANIEALAATSSSL